MRLRPAFVLASVVAACGSATPSDAEIYYAAALRPGVELATTPAERLLLSRMPELAEGSMILEGERFELGPTYAAASGRVCRRVRTTARQRLACTSRPGEAPSWTFVPDPFGATVGTDVPVPPATYDGTASAATRDAPSTHDSSVSTPPSAPSAETP